MVWSDKHGDESSVLLVQKQRQTITKHAKESLAFGWAPPDLSGSCMTDVSDESPKFACSYSINMLL